jgi:hypothetical protein
VNYTAIFENVLVAVIGALVLALILWIGRQLKTKRLVAWFELKEVWITVEIPEAARPVVRTMTTFSIRNRTNIVQKEIKFWSRRALLDVLGVRAGAVEHASDDDGARILIPNMQPRESIVFNVISEYGFSIDRAFCGDHEIIQGSGYQIVSRHDTVVPRLIADLAFPLFLGALSSVAALTSVKLF